MNLLEQIVRHKRAETEIKKRAQPLARLTASPLFNRPLYSFTGSIKDRSKTGIIAEFKRRSPSQGMINATAEVTEVTKGYAAYGASAISILTDEDFFGGGSLDFIQARNQVNIPLLRKDFILEEYQVVEARAMGADAVLLIAAVLTPQEVAHLARIAHDLRLQVLLEVHAREELDRLCPEIDAIGVNNRNLKAFTTDLQHSIDLYPYLPKGLVKISESGIRTVDDVSRLREAGFDGFLVGSLFMKENLPHQAFSDFVKGIGK